MGTSENIFKLIEEQTKGMDELSVEELILDECDISSISEQLGKKLERFANLQSLSMNKCGLKNLSGFPNLSKLVRLELIENSFNGNQLAFVVERLPELISLSVSQNQLTDFASVESLAKLTKLYQLDLTGNSLTELEGYKTHIFNTIPSLEILDNRNKQGEEIQYDDDDEDEDDNDEDDEDDDEDEEDDDEDDDDEDEDDEEGSDVEEDDDDDDDSFEAIEAQSTKKKQLKRE